MKSKKTKLDLETMNLSKQDIEMWKSLYMQNFNEKGLESTKGYIKATIDWLQSRGYKITYKESFEDDWQW